MAGIALSKIDSCLTSMSFAKMFLSKTKISTLELKEVLKVPLNLPISKLMETFQKSHKIMAIIIDEYG